MLGFLDFSVWRSIYIWACLFKIKAMYKPCYKTIHFQRILFLEVGCLEQEALPSQTAHRKAMKQLTELVAKQT